MKILNPTVFLRDGELFCLTVEVPKLPTWDDYAKAPNGDQNVVLIKHEEALASAKSSAVKVKNKDEFLKNWHGHNDDKVNLSAFSIAVGTDILHTLTGYEAEVKELCPDREDCPLTESIRHEKVATISPAVKEESQEELIWEFLEAYHKLTNSPRLAVPELLKRFTIVRKV